MVIFYKEDLALVDLNKAFHTVTFLSLKYQQGLCVLGGVEGSSLFCVTWYFNFWKALWPFSIPLPGTDFYL